LKTPESDSPLTILGFSQTEVTHVNPAVRVADYVPKVGKWLRYIYQNGGRWSLNDKRRFGSG
jgi:hypothetical protein